MGKKEGRGRKRRSSILDTPASRYFLGERESPVSERRSEFRYTVALRYTTFAEEWDRMGQRGRKRARVELKLAAKAASGGSLTEAHGDLPS